MNLVDWVLCQLEHVGATSLARYSEALDEAFASHPPPFAERWYEARFAALAANPRWIAAQILASAQAEGDGARQLWHLSSTALDPFVAEQVRLHAIDESRHSKMYAFLLAQVFPDLVSENARAKLDELSPGFAVSEFPLPQPPKSEGRVLDELIQTNLAEIRTCKNQVLLRPIVVRLCPQKHVQRVSWIIDRLLAEELGHIRYTAELIDAACASGNAALVRHVFAKRTIEFNELTLRQVGGEPSPEMRKTGTGA